MQTLVIGDTLRLREAGRIVGAPLEVTSLSPDEAGEAIYIAGTVDCIDLHLIPADLPWGKLSALAGDAAFRYIEIAAYFRDTTLTDFRSHDEPNFDVITAVVGCG